MTTPGSASYAMPRGIDTIGRALTDIQRTLTETRATTAGGGTIVIGQTQSLTPEQFGDPNTGNGTADDTPAFQAMANACAPGPQMTGSAGKTYVLNDTITFPNDYVVWDGAGCAVQAGANRVNLNALEDRLFSVTGGVGVQFRNTRFLPGLSPSGTPTLGGKIYLGSSSLCVVEHCSFDGEGAGGYVVALFGCSATLVTQCAVSRGSIGGSGNISCRFRDNPIDSPTGAAFVGAGSVVAPSAFNVYEGNTITNRRGIGILELAADAGASYGHTFRDNFVLAPDPSGSAQMGIVALGPSNRFAGNHIIDAVTAGIWAGAYGALISENTIEWSAVGHPPAVGIQVSA